MNISIKPSLDDVTKISIAQLMEKIMLFYQTLTSNSNLNGKFLFIIFISVIIVIHLLYIHISKDFANFRVNFKIAIINGDKASPTSNTRQMFKFYRVFMMLNIYTVGFIMLLSNAIYLNILNIDVINMLLIYSFAAAIVLLLLGVLKSKEEEETLNNILK